jgi:hypothetical protein
MKKSSGSKCSKKDEHAQMPSAFELAVLASFTDGNLHEAFHSYLSASEYLEMNGPAELALRKGNLSEKVEALEQLRRAGAVEREEAVIEYEKQVSGLKPPLRLYKDKRDDAVKSAIRTVTDRPCSYQTARDFLRKAWVLNPSLYTAPELRAKVDAAANPWDSWCDAYTLVGQDGERENYRFLWVPGELLNVTLLLLRQQRKH